MKPFELLLYLIITPITFLDDIWAYFFETFKRPSDSLNTTQYISKDSKGKYTVRNWFGNYVWNPKFVHFPTTIDDLVKSVQQAIDDNLCIKAVGALHSWSDGAKTDGIMVVMDKLNKVLKVDTEGQTITMEAGMRLRDLYLELDKYKMAFETLPNTDLLTVGGIVANAAHGSTLVVGTICSLVTEVTLVLPSGKVVTCRSCAAKGSDELAIFEATMGGMGATGIIYSLTLKTVPYHNKMEYRICDYHTTLLKDADRILKSYESVKLYMNPSHKFNFFKLQIKLSPHSSRADKLDPLVQIYSDLFLYYCKPGPKRPLRYLLSWMIHSLFDFAFIQTVYNSVRVLSWSDSEILIKNFKDRSLLNMEYALDIDKAGEALNLLCPLYEEFKKKGYDRYAPIALRTVGADPLGYMSPTKGRRTVYFDLPYQQMDEAEFKFFDKVEEILLSLGGRASWSRKFNSTGKEVLPNYPDADKYIVVIKKVDPKGIFSNDFRKRIIGF